MGCVDCQNQKLPEGNKVDFTEFMALFDNPRNVTVEALKIVRYKKWFIQADVSYTELGEGEDGQVSPVRITKTLTLGEIN